MQGYPQQQYGGGGPQMQPFYGMPSGGAADFPGGVPPPGMGGPLPMQPAPIRLARFPGSELHAPPPGQQQAQQQMYMAQMQMPGGPSRTGSAGAGGRPQMAGMPPGYAMPPAMGGMQPYQPMMPRMMGAGPQVPMAPYGVPPPGAYQQQQQQGPYGMLPSQQQQQPVLQPTMQGGRQVRSGATTPKGQAGSGANTPMHPMQRTLSGGQAMGMGPGGGYMMGPQQQAQQQQGPALYMQGPGGMPLMAPPPGVVLPDTLSPPASTSLRAPGGGSSPSSRVQSATYMHQQPHSWGGSFGGPVPPGLMEPMQALSPTRGGLARSGSAGSVNGGGGGSLRGSMGSLDFGSALGGGSTQLRRVGSGGKLAAPSSRAGSAGKRINAAAAAAAASVEQLNEYDNIKVAVRVRPPNAQELARGDAQALFVNPNDYRQVQLCVPPGYSRNGAPATRHYNFHACLAPAARQQDVLRLCGITQLLDAALDGYNATVLAYGQTGSGKTFTMSGREEALADEGYMGDSDDGVIARSLMYLFEQLAARSGGSSAGGGSGGGDGCRYSMRVSFAEIYNEQIYDLIRFDRKQLAVRWEASKGFHVPDLLCKECANLEDTLRVLSLAVRHRRVGSHEMNMESSRSHSIFTVYIDATPTRPDDHEYGMTRFGKVSFVDLAGSERLRDSKSVGETLKETTNINRSLFMLGKVVAALADGAQGARVPYRESKLTKLLQDSLGGSSLSLLIACCSPSAAHIEETLSTLSYAARAKNIRNQPAVQVDPEQAALSALKREIKLLRHENAYLQEQLFQASLPRGQAGGPAALTLGSLPASRLPSSHGPPAIMGAEGAGAGAMGSGTATPGGTGGPAPSPEDLMRRLLETQRMLVQFSKENDRLSGENGRLRTGKTAVANDYKGALEEVDWLKTKLEALESALLSGSLDSGLLAALDGGSAAEVLEAARAAVQQAGGALGSGKADGTGGMDGALEASPGGSAAGGDGSGPVSSTLLVPPAEQALLDGISIDSLEPLASQLRAAAQSASSTADRAVAEAAAAAAALAASEPARRQTDAQAAGSNIPSAVTEPGGFGMPQEGGQQGMGVAASGGLGEGEGEQGQGDEEALLSAARQPLIDPYLVANPSELEADGSGSGSGSGASAAEGGMGQEPAAGAATVTATVTVSRPGSAAGANLKAVEASGVEGRQVKLQGSNSNVLC